MIYKHQKIESALHNVEDFQELPSCGIEDVDRAVFDLFNSILPLFFKREGNNNRYPVIYATGERAVLLKKRQPLRDNAGALILPLISIMRTAVEQDPEGYGVVPSQDEIIIKKRIYSNNQDYKRSLNEDNLRFQDGLTSDTTSDGKSTKRVFSWGTKNTKISTSGANIYETFTMPAPRFFQSTYEITFWCQFQQQLNDVYESLMSSYNMAARNFRIDSPKGYHYTVLVDKPFQQNNNYDSLADQERLVKASINLKVNGYVINSKFPGSVPQIKRYVSSPHIVFETVVGNVPERRRTSPIPSGNPEDYVESDWEHSDDALPGSATGTFTKSENIDVLIGKSGKLVSQDLIIREKDFSTGKIITKRYVVKDSNHRKGEAVLREVRTLA